MKFSISHPSKGTSIQCDIVNESDYAIFFGKRIGEEISGTLVNKSWEGYTFKISGGSSKTGTPMMQGILAEGLRRLLLKPGSFGYKKFDRKGAKKRRAIAGAIIDNSTACVNLVLVKSGEGVIEGLTDSIKPLMKGPKRASHIVKMFQLKPDDNVRSHVIPRVIKREGKPDLHKRPKVQRLSTPKKIARKNRALAKLNMKKQATRKQANDYKHLINKLAAEKKAKAEGSGHTSKSHASKSRMSSAIIKL